MLGSLWASFNLDLQSNIGAARLSSKLVPTTTTTDDANLGIASAFEYFDDRWFAIAGTTMFKNGSELVTNVFSADTSKYEVGGATTQFDITNPAGSTFRYTYDGTGTDPGITAATFPVGASVQVAADNFNASNNGTYTVTGSGSNYFEVSNAFGVVESNKTIGSGGFISVYGGTIGTQFDFTYSDLELFNSKLWATTKSKLYSKESGSGTGRWILRDTLQTNTFHKLKYFKKFNRLYYIDTDKAISSIDTSNTVSNSAGDYFIDLGNGLGDITTLVANSQYLWVSTLKVDNSGTAFGTSGRIIQWDGISSQITNEFLLKTTGVLSMVVIDDIPYAIDSEGRVLKYTGYSFDEIARLPISKTLLTGATTTGNTNGRFVHFNGMAATKNNTIQVLINNLNDNVAANSNENLPSGIWELDLTTRNFSHKHAPSLKGNTSSTVTDYGQNRVVGVGALKINNMSGNNSAGRATLLAGISYYTTATATKNGIFIDSPVDPNSNIEGQKRGYLVTTWFYASELVELWNKISEVHRLFLNSTDKIIFKYRLKEEAPIEATITWAGDRVFTTTTDVSAYAMTATGFDGSTGGEVEILQGQGGGGCFHITTVVNNAGTYTVSLDNSVLPSGSPSGTAKARFQKWIKIKPEISGQEDQYSQRDIGKASTRLQIKMEMEFTGDNEFQKFILSSQNHIKLEG